MSAAVHIKHWLRHQKVPVHRRLLETVQGGDVGVIEAREKTRLALEAAESLGACGKGYPPA